MIISNYYFDKNISYKANHANNKKALKHLGNNELISKRFNITVSDFKKVFFDKAMTLKEKARKLKISITTLQTWAKSLGLVLEARPNLPKNISKEKFDEVYFLDIPENKKPGLLNITSSAYYRILFDFGYTAKETLKRNKNRSLSKEDFEKVFFDDTLTEAEKQKKLGLSAYTYLRKAREFGLLTQTIKNTERIAAISKEEFDKIFFDKNLETKHKLRILNMNESTFLKYSQLYGYQTPKQIRQEYIKSITKEQFDEVFYNQNLTEQEKVQELQLDRKQYKLLAAKFGHADEINDNINITIQEFDKVFFDESLTTKEKISKLKINKYDYYYLIAKFGYKTDKQKQAKHIENISREDFLKIANNPDLSEDEKVSLLKISKNTFLKLSRKYGYKSERRELLEHINKISEEEFKKVFFDKNLTEKQKHEKFQISYNAYLDIAKSYGLITNAQKDKEKAFFITKDLFDEVYKDSNLSVKEKCKKLDISHSTYQRLLKRFGYN